MKAFRGQGEARAASILLLFSSLGKTFGRTDENFLSLAEGILHDLNYRSSLLSLFKGWSLSFSPCYF